MANCTSAEADGVPLAKVFQHFLGPGWTVTRVFETWEDELDARYHVAGPRSRDVRLSEVLAIVRSDEEWRTDPEAATRKALLRLIETGA